MMDNSNKDHAAFVDGRHDFQRDIEMIAGSDLVGIILETVMLATQMRFAAVARVTADRWVACQTLDEVKFGLMPGDEIDIRSTFCQTVRATSEAVLFDDVATDPTYVGHPIAEKFGIVSYASIPIYRGDGSFFGTLCAIDTVPRRVKTSRARAMLEMFADIIGRGLEAEERLEAQEHNIEHERELARIQEEFVAVLGHDLRNPMAALQAGLRQLEREPLTERGETIVPLMRSSLHRMNDLVENILVHATERLGGGIRLSLETDARLAEAVTQIVDEIRAAHSGQEIRLELSFDRPVNCDAPRVAQAMSNLLSNAVRYGAEGKPIKVLGGNDASHAALTVTNHGAPVPDDLREKLFRPFERGDEAQGQGLGLGLYIASSIAGAHGGEIDLASEGGQTTFTLRLPLAGNGPC